jgi:hypothetical protein
MKIVARLIIVGLAFLAFIVPEHLTALESHDNCAICRFIQHTVSLESEVFTDITPSFQPEWLLSISGDAAFHDPQSGSTLSRAPPLSRS